MEAIQGSRGTPLWGINLFRADALSQLLNDLLLREKVGLERHECDKVKLALGKLVNQTSEFPDGSFLGKVLWQELQDFSRIYAEWNFHEGAAPDAVQTRRLALEKLRDKRHRIARKIRKSQYVIANELDLQVVRSLYDALKTLCQELPSIFSRLMKAVERFFKRL